MLLDAGYDEGNDLYPYAETEDDIPSDITVRRVEDCMEVEV